jgi:hypothetical protein
MMSSGVLARYLAALVIIGMALLTHLLIAAI